MMANGLNAMGTAAAPHYLMQSWPTARQWDRATLDSPMTVTSGSTTYHGWCLDVSRGGIGFTCAAPLELGDEVKVSIRFEALGDLEARGIVRHTAAFRAGCEFLFISPGEQQLIEQYVRVKQVKRFR
jgi:PilZ domain-containing protein